MQIGDRSANALPCQRQAGRAALLYGADYFAGFQAGLELLAGVGFIGVAQNFPARGIEGDAVSARENLFRSEQTQA